MMLRFFSLLVLISLCVGCAPLNKPGGDTVTKIMPLPSEAVEESKPAPRPVSLPSYRGQAESRAHSSASYSGPAVLSLLKQAKEALSKGRNDQASAALERALRIEPKNPFVWQALAAVHLDGKRAEQAEATAEKSISLAQGNPYVAVESWHLIAQARTLLGNTAGAEAAQEKADQLKNSVTD